MFELRWSNLNMIKVLSVLALGLLLSNTSYAESGGWVKTKKSHLCMINILGPYGSGKCYWSEIKDLEALIIKKMQQRGANNQVWTKEKQKFAGQCHQKLVAMLKTAETEFDVDDPNDPERDNLYSRCLRDKYADFNRSLTQ